MFLLYFGFPGFDLNYTLVCFLMLMKLHGAILYLLFKNR